MPSVILRVATNYLIPLLLLFSIFILLRGHNLPGGGFVGGLIATIAFVLHMFANSVKETRALLVIHPGFLMPIGLSLALLAGLSGIILQDLPFMTALWFDQPIPALGIVGWALLFDVGVYIVVVGVSLTIIFTISEVA